MALDDVLLDRAGGGIAAIFASTNGTLRRSRSATSNPPERSWFAIPALAKLPWLRRATGGAAILHGDGDLTYSARIAGGKANGIDGEPWLCRFHHVLQRAFRRFAVTSKAVVCGEEKKLAPVLCFSITPPAICSMAMSRSSGKAQRKRRAGALLQHGTIRLCTYAALIPELPGSDGTERHGVFDAEVP